MPFRFEDLDARTRRFMLDELRDDIAAGRVFLSPRLSPTGLLYYVEALTRAIIAGDETLLAAAIDEGGYLNSHELATVGSRQIEKLVPSDAHAQLAEGEFNRYYLRGLCRRALEDGLASLEVYRAKNVLVPRARSSRMLGRHVDVRRLLADLRVNNAVVETALGVPGGPNSGLSARIPRPRQTVQ